MADVIFNKFFEQAIDDFLVSRVMKITLIMSNSELETDQAAGRDRDTVQAIKDGGGLDECDSGAFVFSHGNNGRKTVTMTGEVDDTNDLGSMESVTGTYTWSSLTTASRSITGVLLLVEGYSDDTDALPVCYYQFATPRPADGNDFPVNFDTGTGKFIKFTQGIQTIV